MNEKCKMMKLCVEALISSEVRVYLRTLLHLVSMTVLQSTASRDWETVEHVVPGNSSSISDQLDSKGIRC